MREDIYKILNEPTQNAQVGDLLNRCKDFVKMSRSEMTQLYDKWDAYDAVYRGERMPDVQDKKAAARGEPVKMVVPLTYQQVQTFVAFCYSVFNQRQYFFELGGVGTEDERNARIGQGVLERDLEYNKFKSEKLTQFLTDIGRYGIGVLKHSWTRKTVPQVDMVPDPSFVQDPNGPPVQPPMIEQVTEVLKYLGNEIKCVNPYRFFPDPRLPLTRFADGEFCATEDEYSKGELMDMEQTMEVAGIEQVPAFRKEDVDGRRLTWIGRGGSNQWEAKDPRFILITEVQMRLNPSKTMIAPGVPLNKNINREMKYLVWVANDSRIIRVEEMGYAHDEYTIDVSQFSNDQIRFVNFGLAEVLGPLQDAITWFVNARITSVRKVINNCMVVDPDAIELQDLKDRSPILRIKKKYAGSGIDSYIKQLKVDDVTTNHLTDVGFLTTYARESTGITENLMGQFASGRRSAQEARQVANNASNRLLLTAHGIWETGLLPLGRKLLSNLRQGLDEPTLIRVLGESGNLPVGQPAAPGQPPPTAYQQFIQITKADLTGSYDFLVFDGTLPSERGATAMALQELLQFMAQDPRSVPVFGLDPKPILEEILELRNVRNIQRFQLTPDRAQFLMQLASAASNSGGPPAA